MMNGKSRLILILAWLCAESSALAGPYVLSYGGRLTTGQDQAVAGPVNLEVSFFRNSSGGSALAGSPLSFSNVSLSDGVFQIELSGLSDADRHGIFSAGDDVWIEVKDTTHNVTMPRQNYGSVPYALKVPVDGTTITYDSNGLLTFGSAPGLAASGANSDITSLSGLTTALSVGQGGTGATSASGARSALGAAQSGSNSDITSLTGLTTALSVGQGGTGSTSASGARGALGAASSGANSDITSLTGLSTALSIGQGGTGGTNAAAARSNLGLSAAATTPVGTNANELLQLDGLGMIPAVNGSLVTNLSAANLVGTLPAVSGENLTNLPAGNLTGNLPALDASAVTNLNASNITSGNLPLANLPTASDGDILYYNAGWQKLAAGTPGQVLQLNGSGVPTWTLTPPDTAYTKRRMSVYKNGGLATVAFFGFPATPTLGGTASNADDAEGPWINQATGTTSGNAAGAISAAFSYFRRAWDTEFTTRIKTDATLTSIRYWIGMYSANLDAVSVPSSQHIAAFRYDTGVHGTAFWRAVTNDGGGPATETETTVAVNAGQAYMMRVACGASECKFYIDNVLVATHTTTLPGINQVLGYGNRVTTLTGAARNIKWGMINVIHN